MDGLPHERVPIGRRAQSDISGLINQAAALRAQQEQTQQTHASSATAPVPGAAGAPTAPGPTSTLPGGHSMTRYAALETGGARLEFDNAKVDGSIRLTARAWAVRGRRPAP